MSNQPPKKQEPPHQLTLKVMRLAKPSSTSSSPVMVSMLDDADTLYGCRGLDPSLRLAAAFGELYLGETFSCYLTVQNCSNEVVSNVVIKAELQTTSKRYLLHNLEESPIPSLAPKESDDSILKRVIHDEGVHILVCFASYLTASSGRRSFRKFFKFNVSQPFSVSHRQLHCRSVFDKDGNCVEAGDVLIETEIEKIRMVCNDPLFCEVSKDSHPSQTTVYIPASCCIQFLHRLRPCRHGDAMSFPPSSSTLGYLEISWSRGWGEEGTILSPPLYYVTHSKSAAVEAEIVDCPSLVAGVPARVTCRIRNVHAYETQVVRMLVDNSPGTAVMICGRSGVQLAPLAPKQHVDVELTLMPLKAGMHRVGGLVLQGLTERFVFDCLTTCHVNPPVAEDHVEEDEDLLLADFFGKEVIGKESV